MFMGSPINEIMNKISEKMAKKIDREIYLNLVSKEEKVRALEQFKREDMLEVLENDG